MFDCSSIVEWIRKVSINDVLVFSRNDYYCGLVLENDRIDVLNLGIQKDRNIFSLNKGYVKKIWLDLCLNNK